jgi:hypothetical protein
MQRKRFATMLFSAILATALLVTAAASMAGDGDAFDPSRSDVIFDHVRVGETSSAQTVTIRNGGNHSVRYDELRLSGPHPNDFVFTDDCAGHTLAAHETCRVNIRFRPTKEGTRVAHLRFDHDGSGCSNWITLAGSGPAEASASAAACEERPDPSPAPQPTPAVTPSPAPVALPIAPTALSKNAIRLPARSCTSRRALKIHVNPPRGIRFTKVTVKLNTKTLRVVRGRNITAAVSLRGLPRGRFVLHVTARTASGRIVQRDRHYVTCVMDRSK